MRITTVCHYYPPHIGGLEIVAQQGAEALAKAGHSVTLITPIVPGAKEGVSSENGVTVHRVHALNFLDTRFNLPFPVLGIGSAWLIWRETGRADLVHVHDVFYMTSLFAYVCAWLRGKRMILSQHVAIVNHPSKIVMLIQKAVYTTWGRLIFSYAKKCIAYNGIVRAFLLSRGVPPENIVGMRNGVDTAHFNPAGAGGKKDARLALGLPDTKLALFVGRFVPKKGIIEFLQSKGNFDLVLAGSGEVRPEWKKDGVHFLGALSQEKLALAYRAADVFVAPTVGELYTLAMQGAAASGLPIITSDEPEYGADLDRTRLMLVPRAPDAIRQAITSVLNDEALRTSMGEYSRKLAEEWFDEKENIATFLSLFRSLETVRIVTTSWDDGHVLDFKLAALLKKYGIGGTLYVAPFDRELPADVRLQERQVRELAQDFEIGAHTLTHPYLPDVDDPTAEREITGSKRLLEAWVQKPVTSFCYPKGGYTGRDKDIAERAGFKRARTVERFLLAAGDDPFALPTTIHAYDHYSDVWGLLKFVRFNPRRFFRLYRRWDKQARALFDEVLVKGGVFHLWGHSWEIDAAGDWTRLEDVFRYIAHREGVQYVANDVLTP